MGDSFFSAGGRSEREVAAPGGGGPSSAAEESPEVVASFFDFDSSDARTRERELREIYRQRRKDGRRGREADNNW